MSFVVPPSYISRITRAGMCTNLECQGLGQYSSPHSQNPCNKGEHKRPRIRDLHIYPEGKESTCPSVYGEVPKLHSKVRGDSDIRDHVRISGLWNSAPSYVLQIWGPEDHINITISQTMILGIPLVFGVAMLHYTIL